MFEIETPLSKPNQLSMKPRSSPELQKGFAITTFVITSLLLLLTLLNNSIIEDFLAIFATLPVLVAAWWRRQRLATSYAIWALITGVLLMMDIFVIEVPFDNTFIFTTFLVFIFQVVGSIMSYKIYYHTIHNEQELYSNFEKKLELVKKSTTNRRFGINTEALRISDNIGVFKFSSTRNMSLISCLIPFIIILLSRTSNFYVAACYNALPPPNLSNISNSTIVPNSYCSGNINAAGISLEIYTWNLPWFVMTEIFFVRISALYIIYNFLQDVLQLHKYRAKLFGAGIEFASTPSYSSLIEDYIWNFQAIFLLSLLELLLPNNPYISGLIQTGSWDVYEVANIISGNQTSPPGQNYYALLIVSNYMNFDAGTFLYFLWTVVVNCSFIMSVYGYYHNSNNSALLTFFREKEIIELTSKMNVKMKYVIENKDNDILKIIHRLYGKYDREKIEDFVEALLILLEENGILKNIKN